MIRAHTGRSWGPWPGFGLWGSAAALAALLLHASVQAQSVAATGPSALPSTPSSSAKANPWTWWAGHQITRGHRKVPVLGRLSTHLETFYIAKVRKRGRGYEVIQSACSSNYRPIGGVKVGLRAQFTPPIHLNFQPDPKGLFRANTQVQWSKQDLDQDGEPGLSIDIDARICKGQLYVGDKTRVQSTARFVDNQSWEGEITTKHRFEILGSNSFCLRAFARSRDEQAKGRFRFQPLPGPTRCQDLKGRPWPVSVSGEASGQASSARAQ